MRKKVNKLLTILLALTIFLNSFNVVYASEENKTSLGSDASVEMEVEGTDSVGEMLASEIQTQIIVPFVKSIQLKCIQKKCRSWKNLQ